MIATHITHTVEEVLRFWKPEWNTSSVSTDFSVKQAKTEFLPSLSEESENVTKGPWTMDYKTAEETFTYIERLKTKVYVACFSDGVCTDFIQFEPRGEPKEYVPFIQKRLDKRLYWSVQDKQDLKRKTWKFMNCILKEETPEQGKFEQSYVSYFAELDRKIGKLPMKDGMYVFSLRDLVLVRKDGGDPWIDVIGESLAGKQLGFVPTSFLPIFNSTGAKQYWDIPIPTYEDREYLKDTSVFSDIELDWEKKKNTAVFRGSPTGCGYDAMNNPRLGLAKMDFILKKSKDPEMRTLLNAGITRGAKKYRFHRKSGFGYFSMQSAKIKPASFLTKKQQSEFKYIIYAEGNVAAHRLAKDMLLGSVILFVESDYTLWFEHMLQAYQHFVPVKRDLSDLVEKILWCRENDDICRKIAKNAREFALEILQEDIFVNVLANGLCHCL